MIAAPRELLEYVQHKTGCSFGSWAIPQTCPTCGSEKVKINRDGSSLLCMNHAAHEGRVWFFPVSSFPKETACNCGLSAALAAAPVSSAPTLIQQWREKADLVGAVVQPDVVYDECANELEAALAAAPVFSAPPDTWQGVEGIQCARCRRVVIDVTCPYCSDATVSLEAPVSSAPPPKELRDMVEIALANLNGLLEAVRCNGGWQALYGTESYERIMREQLAAVSSAPDPWRAIETMPKDCGPCLVCWSRGDDEQRVDKIGGWEEYSEIIGYGEPPATHWMPLPAPPSGGEP